jgi:hypothetical protein
MKEVGRSTQIALAVGVVASIGETRTERVLATAHPSGTQMTWLGGNP